MNLARHYNAHGAYVHLVSLPGGVLKELSPPWLPWSSTGTKTHIPHMPRGVGRCPSLRGTTTELTHRAGPCLQPPSVTEEENRYSVHRAVAAQKSLLPPFHHLWVKIASVHKWGKKHIVNQREIKLNGRLSSVFPSLSSRVLTALLNSHGKCYFSSWQHVPQRIWMKQISDSFFLQPGIPCSRRMFLGLALYQAGMQRGWL